MNRLFPTRGFLPERDPLQAFAPGSAWAVLDEIGRDLPSLLVDPGFRDYARQLKIPPWSQPEDESERLRQLRLYYVRLGFLASGYINQVGQPPVNVLPRNLAVPLCQACRELSRPPILSYDGYALYNWKRFNPAGPIALGNIDTLQNFVHLYDEHWFILVHVEIEAIAAQILAAVERAAPALASNDRATINAALDTIGQAVWRQVAVLRRIPEKMDPALYYKAFRPYIRFFEHVVYDGVEAAPLDFRGETGAQSSIMPMLVALMKIPHRESLLTNHLADMQNFMPAEHRALIDSVRRLPPLRPLAEKELFNNVLEAMAVFREVHFGFADEYIHKRVTDPRGTGGTPYMEWLRQLIDETRAHKIS
jgi:indoleamine 2,3-dioxygenase